MIENILKDDEIMLILERETEENKSTGWVKAYHFNINKISDGKKVGHCDIRIGHNERLYYGGNIGYGIDEFHRGNHYAGKACKLLVQIAEKEKLEYVIITCNPNNIASRKTCEFIGCKLIEIAKLPKWHDLYKRGEREACIYRLNIR